MKISNRQILIALRIIHCLGIFFGSIVFIYEAFIANNLLQLICYLIFIIVTITILYLLFAKKRPNKKFAYGTLYAMTFVTLLFILSYIYESIRFLPSTMNEFIEHIEKHRTVHKSLSVLIKNNKCCAISIEKHTIENFRTFQLIYPITCGNVTFTEAKSCSTFIKNERNLIVFICAIMTCCRLLALLLLWKYIKDEYDTNNDKNETINSSSAIEEQ